MGRAREILEKISIRACADCEKEFGVKPAPDTSHGQCRRHAMIQWSAAFGGPEKAAQLLAKFTDDHFCPDLSIMRQAAQPGSLQGNFPVEDEWKLN